MATRECGEPLSFSRSNGTRDCCPQVTCRGLGYEVIETAPLLIAWAPEIVWVYFVNRSALSAVSSIKCATSAFFIAAIHLGMSLHRAIALAVELKRYNEGNVNLISFIIDKANNCNWFILSAAATGGRRAGQRKKSCQYNWMCDLFGSCLLCFHSASLFVLSVWAHALRLASRGKSSGRFWISEFLSRNRLNQI